MQNKYSKPTNRKKIASISVIVVIPIIILLGFAVSKYLNLNINIGGNVIEIKYYYLISLFIIFYTLFSFFIMFEKRNPRAVEVVIIAVICAVGVTGRAMLYMLPSFKPVAAIVIIAGVCFGAEVGFLVGAVTAFTSNFIFGQGYHTPFQMFAFGLIGFMAGMLFNKGLIPKKIIPLCIFGGISTFFIYGGILNFSSLLFLTPKITWSSAIAIYSAGAPYDLTHTAATVFFLGIFSKPFIEILDRIRKKYGVFTK